MVGGDDQAVVARAPGQRGPHQRRAAQVEPGGPVVQRDPGEPVVQGRAGQAGQVDLGAGGVDLPRHDLQRPAADVGAEPGPQVGMAVVEARQGGPHPGDVDVALQLEHQLDGVDVGPLVVERRQEEQALLQRGEGPDVGDAGRLRRFELVDLVLVQRDRRQVGGVEPTRRRRRRMGGQRGECVLPVGGQGGRVVGGEHRRVDRPPGHQAGAARALLGGGVDLQDVGGGAPASGVAATTSALGGREPVGAVARGGAGPPEVVHQHLRRRAGGQRRAGLRVQVAQHAEARARRRAPPAAAP